MNILHSADWHIGHRLHDNDRFEEFENFLDWTIELIIKEEIEILILAGDIFDSHNPPIKAQELYYKFLLQLGKTNCKHTIITAGNHDSPNFMEAPRGVLAQLDIHIIGKAQENIEDEIICLKDEKGAINLVVCAIPFLRDKEIRKVVAGESYKEIEDRVKAGITKHYRLVAEAVQKYRDNNIPVIATGHLFATAAQSSDTEKDIHIGNLGQIDMGAFANDFDYIALGHLHRPQKVRFPHIRYSGSPIAMSFSETSYIKKMNILKWNRTQFEVTEQDVPPFRKLFRLKGKPKDVLQEIELLKYDEPLTPWADVTLDSDIFTTNFSEQLKQAASNNGFEILKISLKKKDKENDDTPEQELKLLHELEPLEVFEMLWKEISPDTELNPSLINKFRYLVEKAEQEPEN